MTSLDQDISKIETADGSPGIMAFANIGDKSEIRVSFMGVYWNRLVDRVKDLWNIEFEPVSQFDKPPTVQITPQAVTFKAQSVAGMSDAFSHGDQIFRCGMYKSKKIINYAYQAEEDGWEYLDQDYPVELHVCKSKSEVEHEN